MTATWQRERASPESIASTGARCFVSTVWSRMNVSNLGMRGDLSAPYSQISVIGTAGQGGSRQRG